VYDALLGATPSVEEHESIVILAVDDTTINNVDMYPLSRDFMADGLIRLREFGANYVTFDVEYIDTSPRGVDSSYLNDDLPDEFNLTFSQIEQDFYGLVDAVANGQITIDDALIYLEDLSDLTDEGRDSLLEKVMAIERDNDLYLGAAARFFGNTVMTINVLEWKDYTVTQELRDFALDNFALKNVTIRGEKAIHDAIEINPTIYPILSNAKRAGFPKVEVDPDGVQRRLDLLYRYDGHLIPQLGLAGLLDWLGNPEMEVFDNRVVLNGAIHPDKGEIDIKIPLSSDGKFLINWPRKIFEDSFTQLSYYNIIYHNELESDLYNNLQIMQNEGYLSFYEGDFPLFDLYREIVALEDEMLAGGDLSMMADYQEYRAFFFDELKGFVDGPAEADIGAEYQWLIDSGQYGDEEVAQIRELKEYTGEVFGATRGILDDLLEIRTLMAETLAGKFIIVGYTGTSTTDIGVNPFQEEYKNVGTHASVVNTILAGEFVDDLPWWFSFLIGLAVSIAVAAVLQKLKPLLSIIVGIGFIVIVLLAGYLIFRFTGIYIHLLTPSLFVFITFLSLSIIKFLQTENEKSYVRNAFSHYLSDDVIQELLQNPDRLNLGGQQKYLTAMFTDVQGFSTISEQLDPVELVTLLNEYLTAMSDTVLKQRGTIDKYEGDAIISFFGAPVEYTDHAERACYAAVKMKSLELILNKRFDEEGTSPKPLLTRIGINTGDMVVGNMGTIGKMDYTIMGNSVNLAARLEGVNKQYGTWILISEPTYKELGEGYAVRKLDRVRVVGIDEPIRLYELIDKIVFTPKEKIEILDIFNEAIEYFEERDYSKTKEHLKEIQKIDPDDGPARTFIARCDKFIKDPPAAKWDGVFNLTEK
jgi:adenylate cyclase